MRIHQPMPVLQALETLLASPDVADARGHPALLPARPADLVDIPDWLDARLRGALERRGIDALYRHQVEALEALRRARTCSCDARPRRASRSATTCPSCRPSRRTRPRGRSTSSRPRRSARTSWPSSASWPASRSWSSRRASTTATRRRRIRSRHPRGRPGRGHQPGHAPLGDPAPPHQVVPAVRAAALHRHRRGAHAIGASSGATSRTCCGGWRASAPTTARAPRIVCCSATIGNPAELAETLTGRPLRVIDRNGAPTGEKHVVVLDPPVARRAHRRPARAPRARAPGGAVVPARRPPDHRVRRARGSRSSCC